MARTIGKYWKNEIVRIILYAQGHGVNNAFDITEYVKKMLPKEAFDTWEMSTQEIERYAEDYIFDQGRTRHGL